MTLQSSHLPSIPPPPAGPIVIFLCFPVTRPAASSIKRVVGKLFTEENNTGEQLDIQNVGQPTAGIEQPRIRDEQGQDVVDEDSGEDGQDLIEERERKVQNHAYQQLVFRPGQVFLFYSNHCALIP